MILSHDANRDRMEFSERTPGIELGFARGITNAIADREVLASVPGMGMSIFTKSNELNENASLVYVMCLANLAVSARALIIRFRHWLAPWYRN